MFLLGWICATLFFTLLAAIWPRLFSEEPS